LGRKTIPRNRAVKRERIPLPPWARMGNSQEGEIKKSEKKNHLWAGHEKHGGETY